MATIRKEVEIRASPERVWEALRDIGALHTRLAAGFVVDTRIHGDTRLVTFGNGIVVREDIVSVDDAARRVVRAISASSSATTTARRRSLRTMVSPASCGRPTYCLMSSRATWTR